LDAILSEDDQFNRSTTEKSTRVNGGDDDRQALGKIGWNCGRRVGAQPQASE